MKPNPRDWQASNVEAMVQALNRHNIVYDRSSTGAGKTWMALFAAKELERPVFIVTTLAVLDVWREVAEEIGVEVVDCLNYERIHADQKETSFEQTTDGRRMRRRSLNISKLKSPAHYGGWTFVNREWSWNLEPGTIIIFDEAHRLTGQKSKSAYMLKACRDQHYTAICLSATLAESPLQMRALAYSAGILKSYSSHKFQAWCLLNGCDLGDHQRIEFFGDQEDMEEIRDQFGARFTGINTANVPGFPQSQLILLSVPVKKNPDDEYAKELKELGERAETAGVESIRGRQFSEWQKLPWIVERTRDLLAEGLSVVIFINFKRSGWELAKKLKCEFICADTKPTRAQQIADFQANKTNVIVVVGAAGESFGLHDLHGRPRATLLCPDHSVKRFVQCLGRVPRDDSRQKSVPQYILFAKGSDFEARIRSNLRQKSNNLSTLTNNDFAIMPSSISSLQTKHQTVNSTPMPSEKVEKSEHSPCSPSKLKALSECPHFDGNSNKTLDEIHENTLNGLIVHLEVELYFDPTKEKNLSPDERALYDRFSSKTHGAMADYCIDYAEERIKMFEAEHGKATILTEPRLYTPIKEVWGRCDLLAHSNGHAVIMDWKCGGNYQGDADKNLQGKAYTVGAFQLVPQLESAEFHFVYPLLQSNTWHEWTADDMPKLTDEIDMIVTRWRLVEKGAKMHQRNDHCQYCKHQTRGCPVWDGAIESAVSGDHDLEIPEKLRPSTWDLDLLAHRPEDMSKALTILDFFEKFRKEARIVGRSMVEEDELDIPGYSLVESNSGITCSDPEGGWEIAEAEGVDITQFLACVKTLYAGKLIDLLSGATAHSLGLSNAKAKAHWREELLAQGVIKDGTPYSFLKKS